VPTVRPGAWSDEHEADEVMAEASPAAASPAGPTQTSSEQNSSPAKLSAPGRTETAPRSGGSTGSLDPALYPATGRASPHSLALETEPSLDTALNLVAQSRTNLVALEAQQPPLTALQQAAAEPRTESPSLPAAALAGAPRDLGGRRALPGSHSAPAIAPESYFRGLPAPEPLPRPASRNSGAQAGESGVVTGSRQQSRMEATLFPEPEPAPEPAARLEQHHQDPAAAAKIPLWKRIEAAERAAAAAADRAEAEASGLLFTRDRQVQHEYVANGRGPGQAAGAARRTTGGLGDDTGRMSAMEEAAAALKQVCSMLSCS